MELEFMFDPENDCVVVMSIEQHFPVTLRNIGALNMQEWDTLECKVLNMSANLATVPTHPQFRAAYLASIDADEKARLSKVAKSYKF